MRLHNEGLPGHPTEYHNHIQVNMPTSARGTTGIRIRSLRYFESNHGELPIVDEIMPRRT